MFCLPGAPRSSGWPLQARLLLLLQAVTSSRPRALPGNVKWLSFYDFNASAQHGWSNLGQGTHADQLAAAWEQYRMPGMLDVEDLHRTGHSCGARGCYKDGLYHREWANSSHLNPHWQQMLTATLNESRAAIDSGAIQGFFLGDGASAPLSRAAAHAASMRSCCARVPVTPAMHPLTSVPRCDDRGVLLGDHRRRDRAGRVLYQGPCPSSRLHLPER